MYLQERDNKIRESMTMLKNKRINTSQFLDRILHIKKAIEYVKPDVEPHDADTDESENDLETDMNAVDSNSQEVPKGTCVQCLSRTCDIIMLPCFDIVVCSMCWQEKKSKHERDCDVIYKNNKRKLVIEKKKVCCPCCNKIVTQTKEFRMAAVQF